jgi:glyoxylase-like metal-dependent hydrolase (beta-lactamase superfamily II)
MLRINLVKTGLAIGFAGLLSTSAVNTAAAQEQKPASPIAPTPARINTAPLKKPGDKMMYGIWTITKIGDGAYGFTDADTVPRDAGVPQGSDMYLLVGPQAALLIDLSNNYIQGMPGNPSRGAANLNPRPNVAAELRNLVFGLSGGRRVDVALTHDHPDHIGMTSAFVGEPRATLWASELETLAGLKRQTGEDPSVFTRFKPGEKVFDLGGGRVINTFYSRGHTPGSTTYIYKNQGLVFTGDAWSVGWGIGLDSVDQVKVFASDSQKVIEYIMANFTPYERYALKVFPAHSRYFGTRAPRVDGLAYFDAGYLDWRFMQDMSSAANGVVKGQWTKPNTGLVATCSAPAAPAPNQPPVAPADRRCSFVYGTGAVSTAIGVAYEAAGLTMPANGALP